MPKDEFARSNQRETVRRGLIKDGPAREFKLRPWRAMRKAQANQAQAKMDPALLQAILYNNQLFH